MDAERADRADEESAGDETGEDAETTPASEEVPLGEVPADEEPTDEAEPERVTTEEPERARADPESPREVVDERPARVTYEWSPGGGSCTRCGETVGRLWRTDADDPDAGDGQVAVCADCKDW